MDYKRIISKIAVDKENKKLGKIIRIDKLPGKTKKVDIPYAMIQVKKIFQKKLVVPIEVKKAVKVDDSLVYFDILKKDFNEIADRIKREKDIREKYHGSLSVTLTRTGYQDQSGLSAKARERKK